eukprot:12044041-Alexandrium_andersonii.AAC.1
MSIRFCGARVPTGSQCALGRVRGVCCLSSGVRRACTPPQPFRDVLGLFRKGVGRAAWGSGTSRPRWSELSELS